MGELKLWTSVLLVAARELVGKRGDPHDLVRSYRRRAAREWLESKEYDVGDFLWIVDTLGIDADTFRRRLLSRADREDRHPNYTSVRVPMLNRLLSRADREDRHRSGRSQVDVVDPGATAG
jgi:hypothetical protein